MAHVSDNNLGQMNDITTQLEGATNILLEEPPIGQAREVCTSLLCTGLDNPNILFVSYTRQPSACIEQVADEQRGNIGVITAGDTVTPVEDDRATTESISTPSDLTGLGIQIGQFLSTWDSPVCVCFDSLTSMLQYVDFQMAYEFLHAVTGQVHAANARAHFHIDPNAHDEQTVAGITSLFDATLSLAGEEPSVCTRKLLES